MFTFSPVSSSISMLSDSDSESSESSESGSDSVSSTVASTGAPLGARIIMFFGGGYCLFAVLFTLRLVAPDPARAEAAGFAGIGGGGDDAPATPRAPHFRGTRVEGCGWCPNRSRFGGNKYL